MRDQAGYTQGRQRRYNEKDLKTFEQNVWSTNELSGVRVGPLISAAAKSSINKLLLYIDVMLFTLFIYNTIVRI